MSEAPILITGASSGMGKAAAIELATAGRPLILLLRDGQKSRDAHAEIVQLSGNPHIELHTADLSSQDQLRAASARIIEQHDQIAAFVSNAGAQFTTRQLSIDGIEMTFAVNDLAPFLLSHLLVGPLQNYAAASGLAARVVVTASSLQFPFDLDDFNRDRAYDGFRVYGQSKLANVVMTFELARRLAPLGITANCLAPGFVRTDLFRGASGLAKFAFRTLGPLFMDKPEKAAAKIVQLTTDPTLEGVTGQYFVKHKPAKAIEAAYDTHASDRLWAIAERLTNIV